jgi:hypothetical protein
MSALGALVLAWNLAVFGAHALLPFRLAAGAGEARRRWALAAPVALVAAVLATAALVARRPDEAAAWGLGGPVTASPLAAVVAVAIGALLVTDLVVLAGWRRLEPAAWRLAGALGVAGAVAHAFGSELLRAGWGPAPGDLPRLLLLVALRLPLALVPAELALGRPRRFTPLAGPALVVAVALWPAAARAALGGALATLAAAALLLVLARFLPERLDRAAGWAGFALAVVFLARAAEISRVLGARERVPEILLGP